MNPVAASPTHLLVVEDDPDTLTLLQAFLEEEGYAITLAVSLPASLAVLEHHLFHLVVTDLFAKSGHAPLQSIRLLLTQAAPIPVGVITGWPVAAEAVAQAGLAWLLCKPFDLDTLLHLVRSEVQPRRNRNNHQIRLVEQFFAALNVQDWKRLALLCTPDMTVQPLVAPPATPHGSAGGSSPIVPCSSGAFLLCQDLPLMRCRCLLVRWGWQHAT